MTFTKTQLRDAITEKLLLQYECTPQEANDGEMLRACAMVLRDIMAGRTVATHQAPPGRRFRSSA